MVGSLQALNPLLRIFPAEYRKLAHPLTILFGLTIAGSLIFLYRRWNDLKSDVEHFNRSVHASSAMMCFQLAQIKFKLGQFDQVIKDCQKGLQYFPNDSLRVQLHLQIGHAYRALNDSDNAIDSYRAVIPLASVVLPYGRELYIALIQVQIENQKLDHALEDCKNALTLIPTSQEFNRQIYYLGSQVHADLNKLDEALYDCNYALEQLKGRPDPTLQAQVSELSNPQSQAPAAALLAIELEQQKHPDPELEAKVLAQRAYIYRQQKNLEGAIADGTAALRLPITDQKTLVLINLELALAYTLKQETRNEAAHYYDEALKNSENDDSMRVIILHKRSIFFHGMESHENSERDRKAALTFDVKIPARNIRRYLSDLPQKLESSFSLRELFEQSKAN